MLQRAKLGRPYMGVGRNLCYRKNIFIKNNGFDSFVSVTGGDDDLFVQAHARSSNTKLHLSENSLTYSEPKTTWKGYFRQKKRHLSVGKHYQLIYKIVLGISQAIHSGMWLSIYNFS